MRCGDFAKIWIKVSGSSVSRHGHGDHRSSIGMVRGVTFESQWAHLNESAWWSVNLRVTVSTPEWVCMMVCQYQYKMDDISVWAMRVRCTTILTFSSVLFPFPIIISKTYYSWLALHANKWLTMIGWSFYARHVNGWPLLSMDGHSMLVMSTTLDSRVSLVLFYLKAVQSISAIQNVSHLLVLISLQNAFRLLVFICHVWVERLVLHDLRMPSI